MTITSVMGTALTRTVRLSEAEKGPLLLAPTEMFKTRIDDSLPRQPLPDRPDVMWIDWLHLESPVLDFIRGNRWSGQRTPSGA